MLCSAECVETSDRIAGNIDPFEALSALFQDLYVFYLVAFEIDICQLCKILCSAQICQLIA